MCTTKKIDEYFQGELIGTINKEKKRWVEEFQIKKTLEIFSIFCEFF